MIKIESLKTAIESGEIKNLPSHTSVGGYPLYYLTSYNRVLCADCANAIINDEYEDITSYDTHMEGEALYCEHGHEIESAYGIPETEKEGQGKEHED
jgi:hypothetical protein